MRGYSQTVYFDLCINIHTQQSARIHFNGAIYLHYNLQSLSPRCGLPPTQTDLYTDVKNGRPCPSMLVTKGSL